MKRGPLFLLLLALAGCATPPDEAIVPFTEEQVKALFARARPPQTFGLTAYNNDEGFFFAGSGRVHQGDVARLPMLGPAAEFAPRITMDGRGGPPITALIDTTAKDNWLTARVADQLGIFLLAGPHPYQSQAIHVEDPIGGAAGLVGKVVVDESHVENVVFYMRGATGPLGALARELRDPTPGVVLGSTFLRSFSFLQLDYPRRQVVLGSTAEFPRPSAGTLVAALPLKDLRGAMAVDGALDGDPVTVLLDVAGNFELAMSEAASPVMRRFSLGDLVFPPTVKVVSGQAAGLGAITYPRIGNGLLRRYKVTFDFRNKLVYFERPAPLAPQPAAAPAPDPKAAPIRRR